MALGELHDFAISSRRVLTAAGLRDASLVIRGGRIAEVATRAPKGLEEVDVGRAVLMPGLVDSHVHVNEPGRTEWEGYVTATRAAAAGGITTVVDMPLNCIPVTTSVSALETKLSALGGELHVDTAFWGGVVPGNATELAPMVEAGVTGFKAFLVHSGIDDFPNADEATLRAAMPILADAGVPLLVHAELDLPPGHGQDLASGDPAEYATYLRSRPRAMEDRAIAMVIALARETGCRVHIVHLSSGSALPLIRQARRDGIPITVETCPHYLCLTAEEIPRGATAFKCAPPIREAANRELLWRGLADGAIDFIISDHSPCTPALKLPDRGDFMAAWGGIASLQLGLPNVWTEARARGFGVADIARWMSSAPAAFVGMGNRKGTIAAGFDADLVAWDPDASHTIDGAALEHRHAVTPYHGRTVSGVVRGTWLAGRQVVSDGSVTGPAAGRPILRRPEHRTRRAR